MQEENELIKAAQSVLEESSAPVVEECSAIPSELTQPSQVIAEAKKSLQPINSAELVENDGYNMVSIYEPPPPPSNVSQFQKFGDLPTDLREGEGINTVEIKKLNLAVAVEALERAATAHENFPSPDAGFAVANLSDQVLKLTKDLERSQDPQKILDDLMDNALSRLTQEIVQDLASEMKKLLAETSTMVKIDKLEAFEMSFKTAVNRMGPAMKERLDVALTRISKVLNIKEKAEDRDRHRPGSPRGMRR